jgi:hypothetical protein
MYVIVQGPASARYVMLQMMRLARRVGPLGTGSAEHPLSVVSLGVGPGVDLVGVLSWASEVARNNGEPAFVALRGIDVESGWESTARGVIEAYVRPRSDTLNVSFEFSTVTAGVRSWLRDADLVIASLVWSELVGQKRVAEYWTAISYLLTSGSRMVVIERNEQRIDDLIRGFLDATPRLSLIDVYEDSGEWIGFMYPDEVKTAFSPRTTYDYLSYLIRVE